MGIHFTNNKETPIIFDLRTSPWRPTERIVVKPRQKFSIFQGEEATALDWLGENVQVSHTQTRGEVRTSHTLLSADGLNGTPRSIKKFLLTRDGTLGGVSVHFSPVVEDTWHYSDKEE